MARGKKKGVGISNWITLTSEYSRNTSRRDLNQY